MKLKNPHLIFIFLISFSIILVCSVISYQSIRKLTDGSSWVNHTYKVLKEVESLSHSVVMAQSNLALFNATRDKNYMNIYEKSLEEINIRHEKIVFLTRDNSLQQNHLKEFKNLLEKDTLDNDKPDKKEIEIYQKSLIECFQVMKKIKEEEFRLLSIRTSHKNESEAEVPRFILIGFLIGFTLVLISFILLLWEIKRRQTVEKQLQEKDKTIEKIREFEFLSDSIPQIVWTAKADGEINYYNKHWFDYTGFSPDPSTNQGWITIVHEEDKDECIEVWTKSITGGYGDYLEFRLRGGVDHSYRWHLGRWIPMKDEQGKILKWFGTVTDIDDLKKAQESERASTERLRNVICNAPIVLSTVNKNGIYTFSEGKGINNVNIDSNLFLGLPVDDFLKDQPQILSNIKRALKGEVLTDTNSHEGIVYETHYSPIIIDGVVEEMLAVSIDVTKSKQAETASQFKSRFLASMSHEIRTPLNAILGFANVLKRNDLNNDKKDEYLNHIFSSGNLLLKLIGDILDLSKIEEGKIDLISESFNLKEALKSAISPYKYRANEKSLDFHLNIDNDICDFVKGDAHRINQVIINLLGNAIKFTKEGSVSVTVKNVSSIDGKSTIHIAVADTGKGISPQHQKMIFEPFTQANSFVSREFGGSGLGLSIAKQFVELMGGEIKVISPTFNTPIGPRGTTFEFSIILEEDVAANREALEGLEQQTNLKFERKINVLVVEDNEINQVLAEVVLSQLGCTMEIANHGEEALRLLEKMDFDIILMDIQMPVLNGYETTRAIRKSPKLNIPIVGLSANVYQEDIQNSLDAGMNDHIGKPYTEQQVYNVIRKWVDEL